MSTIEHRRTRSGLPRLKLSGIDRTGGAFYQLSKSEKIQARKQIAVLEKKTDRVYTGPEARALLGLPDNEVRVKPDHNDNFTIFVQSTSVNRKLVPNTRLLLML